MREAGRKHRHSKVVGEKLGTHLGRDQSEEEVPMKAVLRDVLVIPSGLHAHQPDQPES